MSLTSRRIQAFQEATLRDPRSALEALRQELRDARGPLTEPAEGGGHEERLVVTFVWIGAARRVSVRGAQIFADLMAPSQPMTRVEGTDVWHVSTTARSDVTTVYQYLVDEPEPGEPSAHGLSQDPAEPLRRQLACAHADPFNPARLYPQVGIITGDTALPEAQWESILDLPKAERIPWFDDAGAPAGVLAEHTRVSQVLGNERKVTVYTPPGYTGGGEPHPLLILLDGECWTRVARMQVGLDNLIAAGRIAPPVVAFVHNAPSKTKVQSRIAETACNPAFAKMLASELLPWLREHYHLTRDASRILLAGNSYTGLAAAHAAFEYPEAFGTVMSTSGSHWWGYAHHPMSRFLLGKDDEPEWLTRQYAEAPRKPIRFWIDVGCLEAGMMVGWIPGVDPRAASRHFRTVLRAKGNDVLYYEAPGGHEFATFRRSVARGLQALLGV